MDKKRKVTVQIPVKRNNVFIGYREVEINESLANKELSKPEHKRGQNWQGVKLKGDNKPYVDPQDEIKEAIKAERLAIVSVLTDKGHLYALGEMSDADFESLVQDLTPKNKKDAKKEEGNK
jgi:hypothetical protein